MKTTKNINLDKCSVLLIDDDAWMQRIFTKFLGRMGIKRIHFTNNGFEGVNLAIEERPNIIFLDIMMPDINGIQTLQMLKNIRCVSYIPVIIVSANSDLKNVNDAISAGAAGFIVKPFTYATIYDKLEEVLKMTKPNSVNKISITDNFSDNLTIDNDEDYFDFFENNNENSNDSNEKQNSDEIQNDNEEEQNSDENDEEQKKTSNKLVLTNKYKLDISENNNEIKKIINHKDLI